MRIHRLLSFAVLALAAACSDTATSPTGTPTSGVRPDLAITTTFNDAAAPTGTHVQTGTPSCSVSGDGLTVTCSAYELAGVGNNDASASLSANYTATVDCRNHGGQVVEVKAQSETGPFSTGRLRAKNGRLDVPTLSSSGVPTDRDFTSQATCPNGNWTKEVRSGTTTLVSFTYTLTFFGFNSPYITITGP
jgi:hypothetical protein